MAFLNRLYAVLPGFGSPIQNDALFLKNNNALAAASVTTITLATLAPAFSKGMVRVKVYDGSVAAATVTSIAVILSDGTQFVGVGFVAPLTPLTLLGIIPGGTVIGGANGAITTGTAILTSVAAPFTPAMVGLPISITTAGTGATILYANILSYQSATQVTLDRNAGATATIGVMTLTGQYGNAGVLGTSVAGLDFLFPFEVDLAATQVSVLVTLAVATAVAIADVEISTTS